MQYIIYNNINISSIRLNLNECLRFYTDNISSKPRGVLSGLKELSGIKKTNKKKILTGVR